jgi:dTDP-4-dehydrorhamnose 3,5-epimerase
VSVASTLLPGVLLLEPRVFRDERGLFLEAWREDAFRAHGIDHGFVQLNHSRSVRGTLRGLHWQWRRPQAKLVRVTAGVVHDVVVDVRRESPTFARWCGVRLEAERFQQLYVPAGFAHGFCVLSDAADVEYLCSDVYDPQGEAGLPWDDPIVGIEWPIDAPLLSPRDRGHPPLTADRGDLL